MTKLNRDGEWKLVHKDSGAEIRPGDLVRTFRGELVEVVSLRPPHKPGSSGKVCVRRMDSGELREFYAGFVGGKYVRDVEEV